MIDSRLKVAGIVALIALAGCGNPPEPIDSGNPPVADPAAIPPSPRLALVLSSGGPRGFAHIGVLKVLVDAGLRPDIIVGASSGALVGVLYAANPSPGDLEAQALSTRRHRRVRLRRVPAARVRLGAAVVGQRGDPRQAARRADAARRGRRDAAGHGAPVAFTRGDAGAAVRASSAVPGSFAPVDIAGVTYVDGDIGAPLPIAIARAFGAQHVIAVDVAQNVRRAPAPASAPASWTEEAIARRVKIEREAGGADVIIEPPLPYITGFSTHYRRMAIATGEAAAREALPKIRALVTRLACRPAAAAPAGSSGSAASPSSC